MAVDAELDAIPEIELKLGLYALFRLPELAGVIPGIKAVRRVPDYRLTTVYYDTEDLRLFRWGVTLCRQAGGKDAGWHLKLPAQEDAREEISLPLSARDNGEIPKSLSDIVTAVRRGATLKPVAKLQTDRRPLLLVNEDDEPFAELVDDTVSILDGKRVAARYREIEISALLPDVDDQLRAVSSYLTDHGAIPGHTQKVATALGPRALDPADIAQLPIPEPRDPAGQAVHAIICRHVHQFLQEDIRFRRNLPDSVHQLRVAARRLRSSLHVFKQLVDEQWAKDLRAELGWAARELGPVRDSEVLLDRLINHTASLSSNESGVAARVIEKSLQQRSSDAQVVAEVALRSDRYLRLLDQLVAAAMTPPLTPEADRSCSQVFPPLVETSWRKLAKDVKGLDVDGPADVWHETRITAKKARYAVEAVEPVFGKRMKRFGTSMAKVTDVLGDHQDAYVAQQTLVGLAESPTIDGATGFALGQLHAVEVADELRLRHKFWMLWPDIIKAHQRAQ
jgi:CHAD domain-containing protein